MLEQDAEQAWPDLDPAEDTDAMPQILVSSASYRIAVGPQQDQKPFMIRIIRLLDLCLGFEPDALKTHHVFDYTSSFALAAFNRL